MKFISFNIQFVLILCVGLMSCSSQKSLQIDAPFQLGTATIQEWMAGKEESGTGYLVTVPVTMVTKDILFQELYFRGQIVAVSSEKNSDGYMVKGNFSNPSHKSDIVMHADPKMEVGNQPPSFQRYSGKDFPFELESDEAVLSYIVKNRVKYIKISGLKQKSPLIYSSKPKN